ncbi:MAG: glutamate carboxypeptidase [Acidobacteriaceae bacterium]|jgi:glutamate carboxypeptidase|nr:glutamate carboxypeptidase [Acidobacteriaceae bacterium]
MPAPLVAQKIKNFLQPALPEMIDTLRHFVIAESPSLEKAHADRCCGIIAAEWCKYDVQVHRIPQENRGDHLRIVSPSNSSRAKGQLLVLGHYDTVYASGTLTKMPFRLAAGKAYGPGAFDMKAGIVQALFAHHALQKLNLAPNKRIVFLWTSDEEIGSDSSRKLIETEARRSDAVFVLEPSFGPRGMIKTARKGVGEAEIIVHGRASHAGLAPEEGINAVHELCHQVLQIQKWNNPRRGTTVNTDIIQGGTRTNVIADRARAVLDLRATSISEMNRIERQLRALRPRLPGARLEVHGGFNRSPLERKMSAALFKRAKSLATQIDLSLEECVVGGGSDGNLTAALGIPTLDGLGAVGDGAHSTHEHILTAAMPARTALLAALLATS